MIATNRTSGVLLLGKVLAAKSQMGVWEAELVGKGSEIGLAITLLPLLAVFLLGENVRLAVNDFAKAHQPAGTSDTNTSAFVSSLSTCDDGDWRSTVTRWPLTGEPVTATTVNAVRRATPFLSSLS